jgi:peptide/nickel transport system substrate-binding protein
MRQGFGLCVLAAGLATVVAGSATAAKVAAAPRSGGTFRVAVCSGCFDSIDPALAFGPGGAAVQQTTCASLVRLPDKAPPAGYRLVPELAVDLPRISGRNRIYTFRIRKGVRYSTGAPVLARDFAHALDRILEPGVNSPLAPSFRNILGADDVLAGRAKTAVGVSATKTTIAFRLTHADGAFLLTLASLCAVPSDLPPDPEGAHAPLPSAGPYYVSQYTPDKRIVVDRNRYYRGPRPHHVSRFEVSIQGNLDTILEQVRAGRADWGPLPTGVLGRVAGDLVRAYGVNKTRFFVRRGLFLRIFVLNTSRPLFHNNATLRRAVNFAVEREALNAQRGPYTGTPIDHYLSPDYPGYRRVRIYPLVHPNFARARALARGHTGSGKVVVYVPDTPAAAAQAQILQRDLKRIGLEATINQFPSSILFQKYGVPGEPFDIGWIGWMGNPDPGLLDCLFNGKWIGKQGGCNYSYFNSPHYNRLLSTASRLSGIARSRAFGQIDVQLARDAAPAIAYAYDNALTLVSSRTGCVVLNPSLDLAAVCLKS